MSDYSVKQEVFDYHFNTDHRFGTADGFAVAATVITAGDNPDPVLDERIGTLKFYLKKWSDASGSDFGFHELTQRPCT